MTAAVAAMLLVEIAGLLAGGSYWRDYLFPFVPSTGLVVALLARHRDRVGARARGVVMLAGVSTLVAFSVWMVLEITGDPDSGREEAGRALAEAAHPGDTLVVFGGKADVQLTAGLDSPYRHLWSLPMRTLDPGYHRLTRTLSGPDAPTWVVEWWSFDTWDQESGQRLERVVTQRYAEHGTCDGRRVLLRAGLVRDPLRCG